MDIKRKKLLYYEILNFQSENLSLLEDNFDLHILPNPDYDTPKILRKIEVMFAPLGYYCGREKIDSMTSLSIIASNTTGTPHIDEEYAEKRGIKVISLKGETEFLSSITPTAEHTWGLMLCLIRNVVPSFKYVCDGKWSRWPFGASKMLSRMSLGIIGLGRIGKMVAEYGRAFRIDVRFYDPYVYIPHISGIAKVDKLDELVALSDIVTLHVPLNKETEGLLNEDIFSKFKQGSYLINTSRGRIVDTSALIKSLETGKLAGAALDVLDDEFERGFESSVKKHPLVVYACRHSNLLITPHIGGSTIDAWRLTQEFTIKSILKYLKDNE
jgi:D-3-phosphoglycerate dehydrogenase